MGRGLSPLQHAILDDARQRGFTSMVAAQRIADDLLKYSSSEVRRCSVSRTCRLLVRRGYLARDAKGLFRP